jgi:cyclic pyranopterin phosphate synthase
MRYNFGMTEDNFSHLDSEGRAKMVDVGGKVITERTAVAEGLVLMKPSTLALIREGEIKKGDVLTVAQVAGIQAAKQTWHWIPMCHPLPLHTIAVDFSFQDEPSAVKITAEVRTRARTGVEMEALTAVSAAALTIYDMVKSAEKSLEISAVRLVRKTGGASGDYSLA